MRSLNAVQGSPTLVAPASLTTSPSQQHGRCLHQPTLNAPARRSQHGVPFLTLLPSHARITLPTPQYATTHAHSPQMVSTSLPTLPVAFFQRDSMGARIRSSFLAAVNGVRARQFRRTMPWWGPFRRFQRLPLSFGFRAFCAITWARGFNCFSWPP